MSKILNIALVVLTIFGTASVNVWAMSSATSISPVSCFHKFYISNTEINYAEDEKTFQIISKVFTDDLQEVLNTRYGVDLVLGNGKPTGEADRYIKKYFGEKFNLQLNGKQLKKTFIGKEYQENRTVLYFEVKNVPHFKTLKVKNTVLMDVFDEQKNMVHVSQNGTTKTLVLVKGKASGLFNF